MNIRTRPFRLLPAATFILILIVPNEVGAQPCTASCTKPSFATASYSTHNFPFSLVRADFNGDGRPDIATANFNSHDVSVRLDGPTGTFGAVTNFPAGSGPFSIAAADFNGDGKLDLVVASGSSSTVSILLGNGSGSFGAATGFGTGSFPRPIGVADFNGDGKVDVVVGNQYSNIVSLLLGNGDGTLGGPVTIGTVAQPLSIVVADVDANGKLDLVVAAYDTDSVKVLLGSGSGTFVDGGSFPTGSSPFEVVGADVNGDGKLDLAVANYLSAGASILLGNGNGTFQAPVPYAVGAYPESLSVGDFNGDGDVDLAVANVGANNVSVLLGNGDGTFGPGATYAVGSNPFDITSADFNADGKVDLAVANASSDSVTILLNTFCQPRHLGLLRDVPSCNTPGTAFDPQPVLAIQDDAGNLIACDAQAVVASIAPGTGTAGATLGGTTAVIPVGGFVAFTNLSVDLPGRGYQLQFTHPDAGTTSSRSMTQGLTGPTITGPTTVGVGAVTLYDAGPGYSTYEWFLDGSSIAQTRTVSVSLSAGPHTLRASVTQDGCAAASSSITINATGNLSCTIVSPGVRDGTFEAGPPWPLWTQQTSSNFGTPLCTPGLCGFGGGTAGPRSGSNWSWFGGAEAPETATLGQAVTLPPVGDLRLRFQMWIGYVTSPYTDSLWVTVDGVQVQGYGEPPVPESGYSQREIDLTPYANGQPHQIVFTYYGNGNATSNFSVDDVQLVSCPLPVLSINDASLVEGNSGATDAVFSVRLSFPTDKTTTVQYQIVPGTASSGVDYDSTNPGFLHVLPGATAASINVPVYGDTTAEADETFFVDLFSFAGQTIIRPRGTGTIRDDDGPELSITKTDGRSTVTPGSPVTYTIVASNAGQSGATAASVVDVVPSAITGASWTCVGSSGGSCTPGGQGTIYDSVTLPVGGAVTYTMTGTVASAPAAAVSNTASISVPPGLVDPVPGNNAATDTDALLTLGPNNDTPSGAKDVVVGSTSSDTLGPAPDDQNWFRYQVRAGRSYCVEVDNGKNETSIRDTALSVYRADAVTLIRSNADIGDEPAAALLSRACYIATVTEQNVARVIAGPGGTPGGFRLRVVDTTLFSPWLGPLTTGGFESFILIRNTTGAPHGVSVTLTGPGGAVVGGPSSGIAPANGSYNLQVSAAPPAGFSLSDVSAGIVIAHDGPPGAFIANVTSLNFTSGVSYDTPVSSRQDFR